MTDFTKLASYLNSFQQGDPNYDLACYIKSKLGNDFQDTHTINNGASSELTDNDVTMATPNQQASSNTEGQLMSGAFQELDVLNKLKEEKEEVRRSGVREDGIKNLDVATEEMFGDNAQNQKNASLFDVLRNRLKK